MFGEIPEYSRFSRFVATPVKKATEGQLSSYLTRRGAEVSPRDSEREKIRNRDRRPDAGFDLRYTHMLQVQFCKKTCLRFSNSSLQLWVDSS